jgi:excisionase family DNA binding protein
MAENRFLTVAQAAEMLQIDPDTLRLLARRGQVPAAKVGRQWRFEEGLLREWVRERSLHSLAATASACSTARRGSAGRGGK